MMAYGFRKEERPFATFVRQEEERTAWQHVMRFIAGMAADAIGDPIRVRRLITKTEGLCPPIEEPRRLVANRNVTQWQHWGYGYTDWRRRGIIQMWNHWGSRELHRADLEHITSEVVTDGWTCDIQDIVGFGNSKSDLFKFISLDDMAERTSAGLIVPVSDDKLQENLSWDECRIMRGNSKEDSFWRYMWEDGRVYLMNSGGSHHFAAARYVASRLGRRVPVTGDLTTFSINLDAVSSLKADYDMYAMPTHYQTNDFMEAMRLTRAPFGRCPAPYGLRSNGKVIADSDIDIIFLPRDDKLSARVSDVLAGAGVFDFGTFLFDLAKRQPKH